MRRRDELRTFCSFPVRRIEPAGAAVHGDGGCPGGRRKARPASHTAYNEATAKADIRRIKEACKKHGRNAAKVATVVVE